MAKEKSERNDKINIVAPTRHLSKNYLTSRNFLSLLEKGKKDDLKLWQGMEPHYTDLLDEQLKTRRKVDYLESLANFVHTNVRRVYWLFFPLNICLFVVLCTIKPVELANVYTSYPWLFRGLFFFPLALSITNIPLFLLAKKIMHDISYRRIRDKLGLLIFKYFEVGNRDTSIDGGYTKKEMHSILKRFKPKIPYSEDDIARYLQRIIEIEMDRKPRGLVYYVFLKEKYFDNTEKKRQLGELKK